MPVGNLPVFSQLLEKVVFYFLILAVVFLKTVILRILSERLDAAVLLKTPPPRPVSEDALVASVFLVSLKLLTGHVSDELHSVAQIDL